MTRNIRMSSNRRKGVLYLFFFISFIGIPGIAQVAYQYELGFGGGMASYTGDVSRSVLTPFSSDFNVFLRYNKSSRLAFTVDFDSGSASGSSQDLGLMLPVGPVLESQNFTTKFQSLDILMELSFFPYPEQKALLNSSDFSPFYYFGIGVKQLNIKSSRPIVSIPFGVGVKWKMSDAWTLQYRFKVEKLFSDNIDGVDNYYALESGFNWHRQDFIYMNTVSLVLSFGRTVWDCNCKDDSRRRYDNHSL